MSTPDQSLSGGPSSSSGPISSRKRVLACVLCQQRKVKCDRKFPCAHCVKAGVQCVPAALAPRQRRRRFPERDLLDRLRQYEGLLRQNNIAFEPLHGSATDRAAPSGGDNDSPEVITPGGGKDQDAEMREPVGGPASVKHEPNYGAKNLWKIMNLRSAYSYPEDADDNDEDDDSSHGLDEVRETVVKQAWIQYGGNDLLLFGTREANIDLSTLHPEQVQIFKLWQIYLENVNSLLKLTHTPTLQTRIIDAAGNVAKIDPPLEALMFSIYCIAVLSLTDNECQTMFGLPRKHLLTSYQFGCQQALLNCEILRTSDLDCLTALYLYLNSVKSKIDHMSLSCMLGVAVRIAFRMGINKETDNIKCTALEAEMRRRLWWALIIFDSRISETSASKTSLLDPTWDCKIPLNVNDFDLSPEMRTAPTVQGNLSEALFAVVRAELADYIRNSHYYLNFVNPLFKSIAKKPQRISEPDGNSELDSLERYLEDKYLKACNPENPLHMMAIYTTRAFIAKNRLLEEYSRDSRWTDQRTDEQRNASAALAIYMLECDTKLLTSPHTKRFAWLIELAYPMQAYIHLLQDLRKRPDEELAEKSWEVLSDNFEAHRKIMYHDDDCNTDLEQENSPFFKLISRVVLHAWYPREEMLKRTNRTEPAPRIVVEIQKMMAQKGSNPTDIDSEQAGDITGFNSDSMPTNVPMPMSMPMPPSLPMEFSAPGLSWDMGGHGALEFGYEGFPALPMGPAMGAGGNQIDWAAMHWNRMHAHGWG